MIIHSCSELGRREKQEDAWGLGDAILVIADGMGGYEGGAAAAQAAARAILDELGDAAPDPDAILDAITWAARQVAEATSGGGTTIVVVGLTGDDRAVIAWVGDSSVLWVGEGESERLTTPHADEHGRLTRWLPDEPRADFIVIDLDEGDHLVLCTDGITDVLDDEEIARLTAQDDPARWIVDEALDAGSSDNCTVLVYRHGA